MYNLFFHVIFHIIVRFSMLLCIFPCRSIFPCYIVTTIGFLGVKVSPRYIDDNRIETVSIDWNINNIDTNFSRILEMLQTVTDVVSHPLILEFLWKKCDSFFEENEAALVRSKKTLADSHVLKKEKNPSQIRWRDLEFC